MAQVGAAEKALSKDLKRVDVLHNVQCASLKSNMGHLEAAAAAAGLSSLVLTLLFRSVIATNA